MIIAIAGFAGSGKTTLGRALAEKLGYSLISPSFKDLAKKEGVSLADFQERAERDQNIDIKFDEYIKAEAKKGNCVITTWLGPWMVPADLRVWLTAPAKVRARRVAERDGMTAQRAEQEIAKREQQNRGRYLKLYKIDIFDTGAFDVSFNSGKFSPEEMAEAIAKLVKLKSKKQNA